LLILQTLSGQVYCTQNCCKRDGRSPLDVIIEGQQLIAVALENRSSMRSREVLPLQKCLGKLVLDRLKELIHEVEVGLTSDPLMSPTKVVGIVESFGIVRSHVQQDRQRPVRTNPTHQAVQGKFADRDAHSAGALVTDPQDAFAVGDDYDVDLSIRTVAQH